MKPSLNTLYLPSSICSTATLRVNTRKPARSGTSGMACLRKSYGAVSGRSIGMVHHCVDDALRVERRDHLRARPRGARLRASSRSTTTSRCPRRRSGSSGSLPSASMSARNSAMPLLLVSVGGIASLTTRIPLAASPSSFSDLGRDDAAGHDHVVVVGRDAFLRECVDHDDGIEWQHADGVVVLLPRSAPRPARSRSCPAGSRSGRP